jgi:myo-inositol 2-dehydrogenase/D-chiro-inositol 1-dehydrogenase
MSTSADDRAGGIRTHTLLSIGVIGTGSIGTEHVRRLSRTVAGARVHALFDVDADRARALAVEVDALPCRSARALIEDPGVDAVLVASSDESHAEMVLACIDAGKPVLCEKPLAPSTGDCLEVLAAESATGRRSVQVGFMRRYDEAFRSIKATVDAGGVGEVLVVHCVHRNAGSPPTYTSAMSFTNSVIHEIDTARWLLGEELVAVDVMATRTSPLAPAGLRDPQMAVFGSASGIAVEVEVFVNCQYGYDVRCEMVGSLGSVSLDAPSPSTIVTSGSRRRQIAPDWRDRFAAAYQIELQQWVDDMRAGISGGPSSWDGYAATAVAESAVRSLDTGVKTSVVLEERPALYAPTPPASA